MPRRFRVIAATALFVIGMHVGTDTTRAAQTLVVADLEGVPIPATSVADHYCHDFDYPAVHCYRSATRLDDAVALWTNPLGSTSTLGVAAVTYVRVYEHTWWAGRIAYLSQNYYTLSDIGWNDRISSYIAQNSETGAFYTNPGWGGTIDYFCCNQSVSVLDSAFENQISSVKRT